MKAPTRIAVPAMCLSLALAALCAAPARAQRAPDMATLDRGDGITKVGVDLGFTSLDGDLYDGALRLELYGQYVTLSGFGFYGALPVSLSFGDNDDPAPGEPWDPPGDQDAGALGNIDLGLLYVIDTWAVSYVFRGGVGVPTADDDLAGVLTNRYAIWPRLTDAALAFPDVLYIRLSFSPLIHVSNFFLRGDIGFDLGVDVDEDRGGDGPELFRLNVGGGVDLGLLAIALELANLTTIDDFDDDRDDDWVHTLALSLRFMGQQFQPILAFGIPLDDFVRNDVNFFATLGLQVAF